MIRSCSRALALFVLAAPAHARPVLDDFEHGNEALWAFQTPGDTMALVPAAAHDGTLGAEFKDGVPAGWRTRFDLATSPGHRYYAYVRCRGGEPSGRIYLGIGSTPGGTLSAVFAPNSGQIILQANSGYTEYVDLRDASYPIAINTWYVLAMDWAANGAMKVLLLDESLSTVLAETTPLWGGTSPGGVALRGFTGNFAFPVVNDTDTITEVATCYADCNADGALTVADFGCFQSRFVGGDVYYADCNADGALNVADFGCFQTRFVQGCP